MLTIILFAIPLAIKVPLAILLIGGFYFYVFHDAKPDPQEREDERDWFNADRKDNIIPFKNKLKKVK